MPKYSFVDEIGALLVMPIDLKVDDALFFVFENKESAIFFQKRINATYSNTLEITIKNIDGNWEVSFNKKVFAKLAYVTNLLEYYQRRNKDNKNFTKKATILACITFALFGSDLQHQIESRLADINERRNFVKEILDSTWKPWEIGLGDIVKVKYPDLKSYDPEVYNPDIKSTAVIAPPGQQHAQPHGGQPHLSAAAITTAQTIHNAGVPTLPVVAQQPVLLSDSSTSAEAVDVKKEILKTDFVQCSNNRFIAKKVKWQSTVSSLPQIRPFYATTLISINDIGIATLKSSDKAKRIGAKLSEYGFCMHDFSITCKGKNILITVCEADRDQFADTVFIISGLEKLPVIPLLSGDRFEPKFTFTFETASFEACLDRYSQTCQPSAKFRSR